MITIEQAINAMQEPFRTQARENADIHRINDDVGSISNALVRAFVWHVTPQGHKYWSKYYDTLTNLGL